MKILLKKFVSDDCGATAIEYCLIGVLIAVAVVGAVTSVGSNLTAKYNKIASALPN